MLSLNKNHTKSVIATAGFIIGLASIGIPIIRYIFIDLEPQFGVAQCVSCLIGILAVLASRNVPWILSAIEKLGNWIGQKKSRKIFTNALFSLIMVFFILSSLEVIARISTMGQSVQNIVYPALEGEGPELHVETEQLYTRMNEIIIPDHYVLVNFEGTYINVIDHKRVTTDQPQDYQHTIFMFGGSTMVGAEVSDQYTIASHLQRLINESYPDTFLVENMGVSGYRVKHQSYYLMEYVDLDSGDMVIFYDGVNDAAHRFFDLPRIDQTPSDGDSVRTDIIALFEFLKENSVFYRKFIYSQEILPFYLWSSASRNGYVEFLENDYYQHLWSANTYTDQNKALFFHFLQPNLFTQETHTPYEEIVLFVNQPGGLGKTMELGYAAFNRALEALEEKGVHHHDLTDILDPRNRPSGEEYYYDFCHVNYVANGIIAKHMFEEISPYLDEQIGTGR